jgi:hypothetical protein
MGRSVQADIADPNHFTVTLELVPGASYQGLAVQTVTRIAEDALNDGRISTMTTMSPKTTSITPTGFILYNPNSPPASPGGSESPVVGRVRVQIHANS